MRRERVNEYLGASVYVQLWGTDKFLCELTFGIPHYHVTYS